MESPWESGTVVITGAANGIGAALAVELASRGASLALVDIDGEALVATDARVRTYGVRSTIYRADLSRPEDIDALGKRLIENHDVAMLVNNAGVGMLGLIEQVDPDDFAWLFDINFWAPVRLTCLLLPELRRRDHAQIVNVSSVLGLIAAPAQGPYVASKFALRGFSETLAAELAGTGICVTTVYPGGVATEIARSAKIAPSVDPQTAKADIDRYEKGLATSPANAAKAIADGIERRETRILIGKDARRADIVQRIWPSRYLSIIARRMARR